MPANAARASNSLNPFKQDHSLADARAVRPSPHDSFGVCPPRNASVGGAAERSEPLFGVVCAAICDRTGRRSHTPGQRVTLGGGPDEAEFLRRQHQELA